MANRIAYNLICLHRVGGVSKDAIKYYDVSKSLLWDKINYLNNNYFVDVIYIYDFSSRALIGWFRPLPPKQGLTWK